MSTGIEPETSQQQKTAEVRALEEALPSVAKRVRELPASAPWAILGATVVVVGGGLLTAGRGIGLAVFATTVVYAMAVYLISRVVEGPRKATDRLVTVLVTTAFLIAMIPLVSVIVTVLANGLARFDVAFFTNSMRGVVGEGGGGYHAILGTLIITALAALMSIPVGLLTAVYLVEYGRGRLSRAITFFVDVMTGIPSIVAGLFAFALFALFFGPGVRLGIMGAVALSVLMIPIVVRATEEMLRIVPDRLREAAYALGVPKWRMIVKVVLPTALAGIVSGVMLAIARIIGETAPLLVTTGATASMNYNPFGGRMENLAAFAFSQYRNPGIPKESFLDRAWAAALTLILIVMLLNLAGRVVYRRFGTEIR
ncbi:MAG: phosphate ABC transporter permease PstA [Actinomycetes bacterium]